MKLYTQSRNAIIELPEEIWVSTVGSEKTAIISTAYIEPKLGEYESEERARQVLGEIFYYYRNGKSSYIMPEE